jgi:hypothetical protein
MAIISLIAGILGITFVPFLGSIAALITGYMAKKEIRESAGAIGGDGLATGGIVLGWIGVALGLLGLCVAGFFFILIPFLAITSSDYSLLLTGLLSAL